MCEKGYSVSVDFSGPFEPDVDGNTQALVGVEVVTSKGVVGLQQTRTAADTLESLTDFESDLKSCVVDPSVGIAEFHHDDDKSLSHVWVIVLVIEVGLIHTQVIMTLMLTLLLRGGLVCLISQS